ncbi:hypothetical protein N8I71_18050 [Roseibacterium sp. SDUM158016]|jgi:hypothetical protein|uniref:hypothetical protein n=1 Tax=Roseicyclus sediminis TaxID=2980997 RepID=UPI0021D1D9CD|nr:hypothetical protein [Roseibacterium sp. SDUM158016]MCU4654745.1 hypothetical protein [Roseibacterium sp. SDUM158016]
MIFSFLLGVAAGALTPFAEPFVRQALENVALSKIPVAKTEMDLLTLVLLLLAAAILSGGGSAFALLIGALAGIFGKRILAAIQGRTIEKEDDA